ncbi:MAG: hypothetical protein HY000_14205 [Planctomycetes bacterium]|nr:hypothetical protein [Planctomycetota bacterium]
MPNAGWIPSWIWRSIAVGTEQRERAVALRDLGVDLTTYLTQGRADQIIELRGAANAHVHLDQNRNADAKAKSS